MRALQQPLRGHARAGLGHDVAAAQAAFGQRPLQAAAGQARVPGQCIHRVLRCRVLQHMARQLVRQGEWVPAGADVAVLQAQTEPLVHAYLPPGRARYAQVGRQATLHFMDGGLARAQVVGVLAEVERTPSDRVSTLSPRMPSIVVRLRALAPVPAAYRIHQLPLDVSFAWVRPWSISSCCPSSCGSR